MHEEYEGIRTTDQSTGASSTAGAVAQEAVNQVREFGGEVRSSTGDFADSVRMEVGDQLARGKSELASRLRQLGDQFDEVAPAASGTVAQLSSTAADRAHRLSYWLEEHEPSDIVHSMEDLARRRPMTFLLGSLVAGIAVGRLTKDMISGNGGGSQSNSTTSRPLPSRSRLEESDYGHTPAVAPALGDYPPSGEGIAPRPEPAIVPPVGVPSTTIPPVAVHGQSGTIIPPIP